VSGGDLAQDESARPAPEVAPDEPDAEQASADTDPVEYSLFVPGPNGYELIPQSGLPPQAGDIIELAVAEQDEPARFEVLRSSRTLPAGDICVYLAPV
jgi:hypothetical protein